MKRSTKLYLIGAAQFFSPFVWMLLFMLAGKIFGPVFGDGIGSSIMSVTGMVAFYFFIKGFITLAGAKSTWEAERNNPELVFRWIEEDNSKKNFRNLLKNLEQHNITTELYRNNSMSLLNFGDLFYLMCPYHSIINDEPFGLITSAENARKIIEAPELLNYLISNMDDSDFSELAVSLKEEQFPSLVAYCKEHSDEKLGSLIDKDFEKEIVNNKLYRKIGLACVFSAIISFSAMPANVYVGLLLMVASIILGVLSIRRSIKESVKVDWKAIVGVALSAIFIFMTIADAPKIFNDNSTNSSYSSEESTNNTEYNSKTYDFEDYMPDVDIPSPQVPEMSEDLKKLLEEEYGMDFSSGASSKIQPTLRSYTTDATYQQGKITNGVFYSEFTSLYGRLPEGYAWMYLSDLDNLLNGNQYPIKWECGVKGKNSSNRVQALFTIYVGDNATVEDCERVFKAVNPGYSVELKPTGMTIFTNMGLDDPEIQKRRKYGHASATNEAGITREFTFNKVNDRIVCVFDQYDTGTEEYISLFCEY